jgi:hypothetical protein
MRSAPSAYPVGRSRFYRLVTVALCGAGVAMLALWAWLGPAPGLRHALAAGVLLACGGFSWQCVRRLPIGALAWDGECWRWGEADPARGVPDAPPAQDGQAVQVALVADLQRVMLLRLQGTDGARAPIAWLWLEQGADTANWQAMRRAVYFRAGRQAQSHAGTPAANP